MYLHVDPKTTTLHQSGESGPCTGPYPVSGMPTSCGRSSNLYARVQFEGRSKEINFAMKVPTRDLVTGANALRSEV